MPPVAGIAPKRQSSAGTAWAEETPSPRPCALAVGRPHGCLRRWGGMKPGLPSHLPRAHPDPALPPEPEEASSGPSGSSASPLTPLPTVGSLTFSSRELTLTDLLRAIAASGAAAQVTCDSVEPPPQSTAHWAA